MFLKIVLAFLVVAQVVPGAVQTDDRLGQQSESLPEDLWTRQGIDWPRFLGLDNDGRSAEKGIKKDWSDGNLKVLWTMETGEGYSIGSVSRGRFFHFGKFGNDAVLKCVQAETGKPIWEYRYRSDYEDMYGYDGGPRTSPVVDGDRVYVFGVEGQLHCVRVSDGERIWKVDTAKQFGVVQNFFGAGGTPLVFEDQLLVMVGGCDAASQKVAPGRLDQVKPNDCGVVSFNKFSGKVNYKTIDDLASYSSPRLMQTEQGPLVLAWLRNGLHAFDPRTAKVKFSMPFRARKLESVNAMTPSVLSDRLVFVSECYGPGSLLLDIQGDPPEVVHREDRQRKKWLATHWATPVVSGDFLYGSSGRNASNADLRCLNWRTGEVTWTKRGLGRCSLSAVDGHLVVVGEEGRVLLVEQNSKEFRRVTEYEPKLVDGKPEVKFRSPCWSAPVISHGLMWVRGKNKLVCFDLNRD
jgi:outer membrane protein assembly factor BamB